MSGDTEYFFTGRFLRNDVGIENPTPAYNAIHDETEQERFFSYVSTVLPNNARWTMMTGGYAGNFQIPNSPGQTPQYCTTATCNFNSSKLNETQFEQYYFGVLAFQQSTGFADYQFSYFSRFASVHYMPDPVGDLIFNGIATDVTRMSFLNGFQADGAFRIAPDHTLRAGMVVSAEQTYVTDSASVFLSGTADRATTSRHARQRQPGSRPQRRCSTRKTSSAGSPGSTCRTSGGSPTRSDAERRPALRPDVAVCGCQPAQPPHRGRLQAVRRHRSSCGLCALFSPPPQAVGAPENYALFNDTVAAAAVTPATVPGLIISPSLPERSHYFDAGVTQVIIPGLEAGLSAYYKIAQDLIDDGQFGQAYVLTAFNYAKAENEGLELKLKYSKDGVSCLRQPRLGAAGCNPVRFQSIFDRFAEIHYALTHYIYTDHCQFLTASAGISYPIWENTKASLDMIYGSGLRSGFANTATVPGYTQFNLGLSHEFNLAGLEALHLALRRGQSLRPYLRNSRWVGHRRVCSAIWPKTWLLCRLLAKVLTTFNRPAQSGSQRWRQGRQRYGRRFLDRDNVML